MKNPILQMSLLAFVILFYSDLQVDKVYRGKEEAASGTESPGRKKTDIDCFTVISTVLFWPPFSFFSQGQETVFQ